MGSGRPPILIGGLDSQNGFDYKNNGRNAAIGIDWIQGSMPYKYFQSFCDYLDEVCGCESDLYDYGQTRYQRQRVWEKYGIRIYYDLTQEEAEKRHRGRFCLQVSGTALKAFSAKNLRRFCKDLVTVF